MGYIRHHAMIITDCDLERIKDIHRFAELCNLNPTPIWRALLMAMIRFLFLPMVVKKVGNRVMKGTRRESVLSSL
jgi:hypothetical protein